MRSTLRRLIGVTALVMLVGATVLATTAAALTPPPGEGQPASPGTCFFAASTDTVPAGAGTVSITVSVTQLPVVDEAFTVQLFFKGNVVQTHNVPANVQGAPFSFAPITAQVGDTIAVNYILRGVSTYSTSCGSVAGEVITVKAAAVTALAFTGSSSNTMTHVLIALAAIVFGTVLVVGTRRRNHVRA